MLKKLKNFTLQLIAGANVASILLMLFVGYSDHLNPVDYPRLSNVGLLFPLTLIINLAFLIFWLLFKVKWSLIPILGFLAAFQPVRTYCPLNIPKTVPDGALKVISYNVYFAGKRVTDGTKERVISYLRKEKADIVCLQEIYFNNDDHEEIKDLYPFTSAIYGGGGTDHITILSRYPIVGRESISGGSKNVNTSSAVLIVRDGDTIIVVNNHLASTQLTSVERENFNKMMKGEMQRDSATLTSATIVEKLSEGVVHRAEQVGELEKFLEKNRGRSIILCGDFNDSPISHSHRVVSQYLTDCYRACGNGPGISYHENKFYVRIDHMFASSDWEPYRCFVDSKVKFSDHYPVVCWLKKTRKP